MFLKRIRKWIKTALYIGKGRFCPVCEHYSRKFAMGGAVPRKDAKCIRCGAVERHRLVWLYLKKQKNFFRGDQPRMLHVAPEACFASRFRNALGTGYVTADLDSAHVDVKMDITDIQFGDGVFDVIYCSHVLEHVTDDRKAMREFHRVLKPGGWAILLVPITSDKTFEDPSVTDPSERLRLFGQEDHVRRYGPDYLDRLTDAGFCVRVVRPQEFLTAEEIARMGITPAAGDIFDCSKAQ